MLSTVILSASAGLTSVHADDTDKSVAAQDATISNAKSESAKAQAQVDSMQSQVDSLQAKQSANKDELTKLTKASEEASAQIAKLAGNIKERSSSLEAQARSAQTNGSATNYLNAVLDSDSLTDAIQKVTAMATVASANKSMLDQQKADQKAIQKQLADNQAKYAKATQLQQDLAAQSKEITTQQAQLKVAQLNYQATITTAEGKKTEILAEKAAAEKAAQEAAAAQKAAAAQQAEAEKAAAAQAQTQTAASAPAASSDTTTPSSSTPAASDNSNTASSSTPSTTVPTTPSSGSNPYPWGQCTWGVWQILGGNMPTYSGNAGDWVAYANSGLAVGTIAVFPPGVDGAGGFGHVGVVTSVSGGSFTISEANFNTPVPNGAITSRTIPSAAGVSFIRP